MSVNSEAEALVNGQRQKDYGPPGPAQARIAKLWTIALEEKLKDGVVMTGDDVSILMTLVKFARLIVTPTHRDSQVDVCGYMGVMELAQQPKLEIANGRKDSSTAQENVPTDKQRSSVAPPCR